MAKAPLSPLGALVRRSDPDRFLCALFAPAEAREGLFLLAAYNHELARAREAGRNPLLARVRLQWWREAVEAAAAGAAARRHEVAGPLHAAIVAGELEAAELLALADAREIEAEESVPSTAALLAYLRGTAGAMAVLAGRRLGAPAAALPGLQEAGLAYGLAGVLRAVPALAAQGRCLLPEDALAAAGLTPAEAIAAPGGAAVAGVVRALAGPGLDRLRAVRPALRALPRGAVAAALPGLLARRDLRRLAAGRGDPGARGLADRLAVVAAGLSGRV
jgi:phytoene synthase